MRWLICLSKLMATAVVLSTLAVWSGIANSEEPSPDPHELKAQRFIDRIKANRETNDVPGLFSLVGEFEEEWRTGKDANYFRVVIELCSALNSVDSSDTKRFDSVRTIATAALEIPGDKPVGSEVKLLLFLQSDPDYTRGTLRGEEWRKERLVRVQRWLKVWRHLREEQARLAKMPGGRARFNVAPPLETGFPAGVSPTEIKDPVLRKQYEEAIARNAELAALNGKKIDLDRLTPLLLTSAKRYLVEAYSKPPFQTDELEKSLAEPSLDKETCAAILEEVKKRVAAKIEEEAKLSQFPSGMVITEPAPPGTGPHHADPRLAVKLSFDQKSPLVEDTLRELRKSTSVDLTRADDIQNRHPAVGSFSFRNTPAWRVMDDLAASKRVEGRWEKEGDGYRLVSNGNPVTLPEDTNGGAAATPGSDLGPRLYLTAAIVVVLLVVSGAIWWFRSSRKKPTPPPTRG